MSRKNERIYHSIPKVDKILLLPELAELPDNNPRQILLAAVRTVLGQLRSVAVNGRLQEPLGEGRLCEMIRGELSSLTSCSLHPVVNGTGVVLHTNLGRSLLAESVSKHVSEISQRYSNLEMNIATGERGERYTHVEGLLCTLTGAESALVVNNNAAAVLLVLSAVAAGREVIVSRGELVEVGGGFRIPDVMRQSGCVLREVGTTNRTHLRDYSNAVTPDTALLLKIHSSNFKVMGFTAEVEVPAVVKLGKELGVPVMADIGSGCILDLSRFGIPGENPVSSYIKAGVDILTCSGDKLLGGPQAGIILGKKEMIDRLRSHPLLRALRIDKLTLAALEGTLMLYQDQRRAIAEIPTLRMLTVPSEVLQKSGRKLIRRLRRMVPTNVALSLQKGHSLAGGGALPLLELESCLLEITVEGCSPANLDLIFRSCRVPVVGRVWRNSYLLDLRTVQECDFDPIVTAISTAATSGEEGGRDE